MAPWTRASRRSANFKAIPDPRNTRIEARAAASLWRFLGRTMASKRDGDGSLLRAAGARFRAVSWRNRYSLALRHTRRTSRTAGGGSVGSTELSGMVAVDANWEGASKSGDQKGSPLHGGARPRQFSTHHMSVLSQPYALLSLVSRSLALFFLSHLHFHRFALHSFCIICIICIDKSGSWVLPTRAPRKVPKWHVFGLERRLMKLHSTAR